MAADEADPFCNLQENIWQDDDGMVTMIKSLAGIDGPIQN